MTDEDISVAGAAANKQTVRHYFDAMARGDTSLPELLTDDVTWWVPPSSPLGGLHRGRAAVLRLMAGGVDIYDRDTPRKVAIESLVAESDRVCVELSLDARTARGEDYRHHYLFAFRLRDGRICEVREHLDTLYAHQRLFGGAAEA